MLRLLPYVIIALLLLTISKTNELVKGDIINKIRDLPKIFDKKELLAEENAKTPVGGEKALTQAAREMGQNKASAQDGKADNSSTSSGMAATGAAMNSTLQEFEYKETWEELMGKRNYCINLLEKTEFNREEIDILQDLKAKRQDLELNAEKIEVMREGVELMKQEVQRKIEELSKIRNEIKLHGKGGEALNLSKLIRIYESMKPEDSARIFNLLSNEELIDIAENMKENKFAAILSRMDLKKIDEFNKAMNYRRILLSD